MITLAPFLVFVAAAAVPAIFLFFVSRWIELEDRKVRSTAGKPPEIQSRHFNREAA